MTGLTIDTEGRFPELVTTYIGPNEAHRRFRTELANVKALAFILIQKRMQVLSSFLEEMEAAKRDAPRHDFAIGMANDRCTTTSVQFAINITRTEIEIIETDTDGFIAQSLGLIYREVNRVFETFVIDLFEEIAERDKRVLKSEQKISHEEILEAGSSENIHKLILRKRKDELTRIGFGGLEKVFDGLRLPIVSSSSVLGASGVGGDRYHLILMNAIRNVIEHNRSVVNDDFLKLVPDSKRSRGDVVRITVTELGDAIAAVQWVGDDLNRRAVAKYALGHTP